MLREYEKKLHMKLISIGKFLAKDDMMDSDTTGKQQNQQLFLIYMYNFLFKLLIFNFI